MAMELNVIAVSNRGHGRWADVTAAADDDDDDADAAADSFYSRPLD